MEEDMEWKFPKVKLTIPGIKDNGTYYCRKGENSIGYYKDQPYISHCVDNPSRVALQKLDPPKIPHRAGSNIQ